MYSTWLPLWNSLANQLWYKGSSFHGVLVGPYCWVGCSSVVLSSRLAMISRSSSSSLPSFTFSTIGEVMRVFHWIFYQSMSMRCVAVRYWRQIKVISVGDKQVTRRQEIRTHASVSELKIHGMVQDNPSKWNWYSFEVLSSGADCNDPYQSFQNFPSVQRATLFLWASFECEWNLATVLVRPTQRPAFPSEGPNPKIEWHQIQTIRLSGGWYIMWADHGGTGSSREGADRGHRNSVCDRKGRKTNEDGATVATSLFSLTRICCWVWEQLHAHRDHGSLH